MRGALISIALIAVSIGLIVIIKGGGAPEAIPQYEKRFDYISTKTLVVGKPEEAPLARHTFNVQNSGSCDWNLKLRDRSCSCTVVSIAEPFVRKGGTCDVTIEFDVSNVTDTYSQSVLLETGDASFPRISLALIAKVYQKLNVQLLGPERLTAFCGDNLSIDFAITAYHPTKECDMFRVSASKECYPVITGEQKTVQVESEVFQTTSLGRCTLHIPETLSFREEKISPHIEVTCDDTVVQRSMSVEVAGHVQASPTQMVLRGSDRGFAQRDVKLTCRTPLRIESITVGHPCLTADVSKKSKANECVIAIRANLEKCDRTLLSTWVEFRFVGNHSDVLRLPIYVQLSSPKKG